MIAKRFEDLLFWQKVRKLTKYIYKLTNNSGFKQDYGLKDQIQRASVSIMSNIAEGFGRGGNNEFIQFLFLSKGSNSEVQSQLYIAFDLGYIDESTFNRAYDLADEIGRLINSFIKSLKSSDKTGLKRFTPEL